MVCPRDRPESPNRRIGVKTRRVIGDGAQLFECIICLRISHTPILTPCKHLFCEVCLETWSEQFNSIYELSCPMCRQQFSLGSVCYYFDMDDERKSVFPRLKFPCRNKCGQTILGRDVSYHLQFACPQRTVSCPNTHCNKRILCVNLPYHINNCRLFTTYCNTCFLPIYEPDRSKHNCLTASMEAVDTLLKVNRTNGKIPESCHHGEPGRRILTYKNGEISAVEKAYYRYRDSCDTNVPRVESDLPRPNFEYHSPTDLILSHLDSAATDQLQERVANDDLQNSIIQRSTEQPENETTEPPSPIQFRYVIDDNGLIDVNLYDAQMSIDEQHERILLVRSFLRRQYAYRRNQQSNNLLRVHLNLPAETDPSSIDRPESPVLIESRSPSPTPRSSTPVEPERDGEPPSRRQRIE
jgi:hypothetical protein